MMDDGVNAPLDALVAAVHATLHRPPQDACALATSIESWLEVLLNATRHSSTHHDFEALEDVASVMALTLATCVHAAWRKRLLRERDDSNCKPTDPFAQLLFEAENMATVRLGVV